MAGLTADPLASAQQLGRSDTMGKLTTIALLERKQGISRDLFSRYWRDVHGVMAARIPGFDSYVQHHVDPITDIGSRVVEPFEGIAVVTFANAEGCRMARLAACGSSGENRSGLSARSAAVYAAPVSGLSMRVGSNWR